MEETTQRCEDCGIKLTDDQVCGMPAYTLCEDCWADRFYDAVMQERYPDESYLQVLVNEVLMNSLLEKGVFVNV